MQNCHTAPQALEHYAIRGRNRYFPDDGYYFFDYVRGRYSAIELTRRDDRLVFATSFSLEFNEMTALFDTRQIAMDHTDHWLQTHFLPPIDDLNETRFPTKRFRIDPDSVQYVHVIDRYPPISWSKRFILSYPQEITNS